MDCRHEFNQIAITLFNFLYFSRDYIVLKSLTVHTVLVTNWQIHFTKTFNIPLALQDKSTTKSLYGQALMFINWIHNTQTTLLAVFITLKCSTSQYKILHSIQQELEIKRIHSDQWAGPQEAEQCQATPNMTNHYPSLSQLLKTPTSPNTCQHSLCNLGIIYHCEIKWREYL